MSLDSVADRVLRDEIWESKRFLDLPTDVARLAFIRFLSIADDFGNFEGGPRRLYRILHACTMIKTEEAAAQAIDALMLADLIRRYEVEGRELFHIPKLRPHRQYLVQKMPSSPWDVDASIGKNRPVSIKQRIVGSRSEKTATRAARLKPEWKLPKAWGQWAMEKFPQMSEADVRLQADNFRDYWIGVPGQRGVKLDWYATWRNSVRRAAQIGIKQQGAGNSNWWASNAGIDTKGRELGLTARGGESYDSYKNRIFEQLKAEK